MTIDNIKKTLKNISDEFLAFLYKASILKDPWEERKRELCKGLDNSQAITLMVLLDNTRAFIINHRKTECGPSGMIGPNLYDLMPDLVAETYKSLLCKHLIAVQPARGPVGLVYTLDYKEDGTVNDEGRKRLTLNIISHAVETATQRLKACWTIEALQDVQSFGAGIKDEIVKAFGAEVAHEMDGRIIDFLIRGAAHSETVNLEGKDLSEGMNRLGITINLVCNEIARTTRRGAGNWILTSPMVIGILQTIPGGAFVPAPEGSFKTSTCTRLAGILNGTIEVYSTLLLQPLGLIGGEDTILIGYKGLSSSTDAGLVFSPYMLLLPEGVIVNPVTFAPLMAFFTRYGLSARGAGDDLTQTKNYYGVLKIQGLPKFE